MPIHLNRQFQSLICIAAAKTFPSLVLILLSSVTLSYKNTLLLTTEALFAAHEASMFPNVNCTMIILNYCQ